MGTVRLLGASLALAMVLGLGSAAALGSGNAGVATADGVGFISLGGAFPSPGDQARFAVVIGAAGQASLLARMPGRTLAYFSGTDVNTGWSTGVPYATARAHGWLLTGPSGNLLVSEEYSGDYVGDVGSPGYQRAWVRNVLGYLRAHPGVKGIFIDDVLYDLRPLTGEEAAKYPSHRAWARAQLSFIVAVSRALRTRGYYVLVNASGYLPGSAASDDGTNTVTWWRKLGPYVDGLMNEYYQEIPDGSDRPRSSGEAWSQNWPGWQRLIQTAQAMGKDFYGLSYAPLGDTGALDYGRASFLLEWDGGGGAFIDGASDGSDAASPVWAMNIGQPAEVERPVGVGWMRRYSCGVALVDPSPTASQTFGLGGTYRLPSGQLTSSLSLTPTTGAVLQAASAGPGAGPGCPESLSATTRRPG